MSGTIKTVKNYNTKTEGNKMRQSSIMKLDRTHQDKEFIENLANEKCVYYVSRKISKQRLKPLRQ